jgi:hypothetical protein
MAAPIESNRIGLNFRWEGPSPHSLGIQRVGLVFEGVKAEIHVNFQRQDPNTFLFVCRKGNKQKSVETLDVPIDKIDRLRMTAIGTDFKKEVIVGPFQKSDGIEKYTLVVSSQDEEVFSAYFQREGAEGLELVRQDPELEDCQRQTEEFELQMSRLTVKDRNADPLAGGADEGFRKLSIGELKNQFQKVYKKARLLESLRQEMGRQGSDPTIKAKLMKIMSQERENVFLIIALTNEIQRREGKRSIVRDTSD